MILPKKTKINFKNRTLKKKKFKNKFYKVTKRNNLRISKKKGGASPGKVNYSIGTNFYDCSGTGNEVKINKLSEEPTSTSEPKIIEPPYPRLEDYNKGDFIQYGNIFLFCKELKKDNVIFEIYNDIPDGKYAKFKVAEKPIEDGDGDEDEPGPGTEPEPGPGTEDKPKTEEEEGNRDGTEPEARDETGDQPGEDEPGPKSGPITTYYYDKLKLNEPKEGVGLDKKTITLLNANMEKVLSQLDNYKEGDSDENRKIEIETQNLMKIEKKNMLPEEYLKNLDLSHGYQNEIPSRALVEICSYFYEGDTKKVVPATIAINKLKEKAELELKKAQNK